MGGVGGQGDDLLTLSGQPRVPAALTRLIAAQEFGRTPQTCLGNIGN
jgi:hypothetical protein